MGIYWKVKDGRRVNESGASGANDGECLKCEDYRESFFGIWGNIRDDGLERYDDET